MVLRSLLFNVAFYVNALLWTVLCLPGLLLPHRQRLAFMHAWASSSIWLLKVVAGVRVEYRGDRTRFDEALLVASKHQSLFETYALVPRLADPAIVLKHELTRIPFFGWWLTGTGMIGVRRDRGARALKDMARTARQAAQAGRQVLIFPEGTRRPPGAPPDYKVGVLLLYEEMGVPCLPVALNSGLYWPRRRWQRYPGTIVVEFLEPIPPHLPRKTFLKRLEDSVETASDRLLLEASESPNPPPLPEAARARLEALAAAPRGD